MAAPVRPTSGRFDDIFIRRKRRARLRVGLLGEHLPDFAASLAAQGYRRDAICKTVSLAHWFGAFSSAAGINSAAELTEELVEQYLAKRVRLGGMRAEDAQRARGRLHRLLAFLREREVIAPDTEPPLTPKEQLLCEFVDFSRDHRGIRPTSTLAGHRKHAGAFLDSLGEQACATGLGTLGAASIRRFLVSHCESLGRSERIAATIALRGFLRFARIRGYVPRDLVTVVPVIPRYRLDRVPPVLAWEDIQKTIRAVDPKSVKGRRDRALLLILATYGMRIGQIRALRLDDLDWRAGTIRFLGVKGGRDVVLPLTAKVGEALVAWLKARPGVAFREVFLRLRVPIRPLRSNLYPLIERHARKAGVTAPIVGARTWRHGRATRMLERGVSLKTIRDMLGHRSIESTFIYTKVDLPMLRQAALEWPGGES